LGDESGMETSALPFQVPFPIPSFTQGSTQGGLMILGAANPLEFRSASSEPECIISHVSGELVGRGRGQPFPLDGIGEEGNELISSSIVQLFPLTPA